MARIFLIHHHVHTEQPYFLQGLTGQLRVFTDPYGRVAYEPVRLEAGEFSEGSPAWQPTPVPPAVIPPVTTPQPPTTEEILPPPTPVTPGTDGTEVPEPGTAVLLIGALVFFAAAGWIFRRVRIL